MRQPTPLYASLSTVGSPSSTPTKRAKPLPSSFSVCLSVYRSGTGRGRKQALLCLLAGEPFSGNG